MLLIGREDSSICTGKKCSLVNHRQSPVYKLVQNPNLQAECSVELSIGCLQSGMYFPSETKLYMMIRPPGHLEKMIETHRLAETGYCISKIAKESKQ